MRFIFQTHRVSNALIDFVFVSEDVGDLQRGFGRKKALKGKIGETKKFTTIIQHDDDVSSQLIIVIKYKSLVCIKCLFKTDGASS